MGNEEQSRSTTSSRRDFFDLIVIDECHRGSARDDSAWREILEYFDSAIQLGMTATPKETKYVSNIHYFGEPVYTYSLKQGIEDGFLAPYKVVRIDLDKDLLGWRPEKGQVDDHGELIEDRIYNQTRLRPRHRVPRAGRSWSPSGSRRSCTAPTRCTRRSCSAQNIDHAERMRQALVNVPENADAGRARTTAT